MNYDDSMTINVSGGNRGEGGYGLYIHTHAGFAGSAGKVFLVSRLICSLHSCSLFVVSQIISS